MFTLRSVLLLNGISSGVTGLALAALSGQVASIFAVNNASPFLSTGIFLMLFALFVIVTAVSKSHNPRALNLITALDLLWIVASVALIIADGHLISAIGNVVIAAVAAWVGLMVVIQRKKMVQRSGEEKQLVSL